MVCGRRQEMAKEEERGEWTEGRRLLEVYERCSRGCDVPAHSITLCALRCEVKQRGRGGHCHLTVVTGLAVPFALLWSRRLQLARQHRPCSCRPTRRRPCSPATAATSDAAEAAISCMEVRKCPPSPPLGPHVTGITVL